MTYHALFPVSRHGNVTLADLLFGPEKTNVCDRELYELKNETMDHFHIR